jgi:hypothetical protein
LVTVTVQVPGAEAFKVVAFDIEHDAVPALISTYVNAPEPEPPVVTNASPVPNVPRIEVRVRLSCEAFCTIGFSHAEIDDEYTKESVGVRVADNCNNPTAVGLQSQNADVDTAETVPHPGMVTPPTMKFTVPGCDVVAVIRAMLPYVGETSATAMLIVVSKYAIERVKSVVAALTGRASVTVTLRTVDPATVGVPVIAPVALLKFSPAGNEPVNAYVKGAIPPDPPTVKAKALFTVPDSPAVGVEITNVGGLVMTKTFELSAESL